VLARVLRKVSLSREYTKHCCVARTVAVLNVLYSKANSPKLLPSFRVATMRPFTRTSKDPFSMM
jgi:hypothetical protein